MSITSGRTRPENGGVFEEQASALEPTFALRPEVRVENAPVQPAPMPVRKPRVQPKLADIEGYEILSELGRGGMAIVFKARQLALNRIVALKMVLGGEYREPEFHIRFQMEAEAVARLQHPNIIQIFDYSTISGMFPGEMQCPYIAFEYVDGGNLSHRIRGLPQAAHEAAHIVEILADAVQYAHRCGIIHRDLKPSNVLLTSEGVPKISDFGLAKILDDGEPGAALTAAGAVLGTPEYMSPEQTSPNCRVSHSADIYSLGVILYELLTGRRPFEGGSVMETVRQVCTRDPVRPRVLQPGVPRDLETICLKCLRKEPRQRYSTAQGLADDLRRFQKGQPIVARAVGPFERAWKWGRRHHSLAALLFFTLALVILGLPGVTFLWISADQAKTKAVAEERVAVKARAAAIHNLGVAIEARDEARKLRLEGERREARLALDQGLVLCQQGQIDAGLQMLRRSRELYAPFNDEGAERVLRINLENWPQQLARRLRELEPYAGRTGAALFLPNNTALVAHSCFTRQFDLSTGKPVTEPCGGPVVDSVVEAFAKVMSVAVSPDQKTAAIGRSSGAIQFWDIAARKPVPPVLRHQQDVWGLGYCPVSERLAAAHAGDVVIWDRQTGEKLRIIPHPTNVSQVQFEPSGRTLITAAWDGKLRLFDVESGALLRELKVQKDRLGTLALSPAGDALIVGGREGHAMLFSFPELLEIGPPLRHTADVTTAAFSSDGHMVVTGGRDDTVRVWEAASGRPLAPPIRFTAEVNAVAISNDGRRCLVAVNNGQASLWELPRGRQQGASLEHRHAIESLAFLPSGDLVSGCANAVYVWDAEQRVKRHTLSAGRMRLRGTTCSATGSHILAARWDDSLWEWAVDGTKIATPTTIAIDQSASVIVGAGSRQVWLAVPHDQRNRLTRLDLANGKTGPHSLTHASAIQCAAISPNETLLATGCRDGSVRLWDAASGKLQFLLNHPERVEALCFNAAGTRLGTACRDGIARIWDPATGRLCAETPSQQSPILALAFSADGALLATGGGDCSARFWDSATGIMLGAPLWHIDAVQALAFDPSGTLLATGCRDGYVRFWSLPTD